MILRQEWSFPVTDSSWNSVTVKKQIARRDKKNSSVKTKTNRAFAIFPRNHVKLPTPPVPRPHQCGWMTTSGGVGYFVLMALFRLPTERKHIHKVSPASSLGVGSFFGKRHRLVRYMHTRKIRRINVWAGIPYTNSCNPQYYTFLCNY